MTIARASLLLICACATEPDTRFAVAPEEDQAILDTLAQPFEVVAEGGGERSYLLAGPAHPRSTFTVDLEPFGAGQRNLAIDWPAADCRVLVPDAVDPTGVVPVVAEPAELATRLAESNFAADPAFCVYDAAEPEGSNRGEVRSLCDVPVRDVDTLEAYTVRVELGRDHEPQILARSGGRTEWGISWRSSQCKKACRARKCTVSYSRLLALAIDAGLSVPAHLATAELLAAWLEKQGVGWSGECRKVKFLGLIGAGCQCWLATWFDSKDPEIHNPVE